MDQSTARIGDHGELTIPKSVRDRVGLAPGVEVDFVVEDAGLRLVRVDRPVRKTRGQCAVEAFTGSATTKMTAKEWMALLRDDD